MLLSMNIYVYPLDPVDCVAHIFCTFTNLLSGQLTTHLEDRSKIHVYNGRFVFLLSALTSFVSCIFEVWGLCCLALILKSLSFHGG